MAALMKPVQVAERFGGSKSRKEVTLPEDGRRKEGGIELW